MLLFSHTVCMPRYSLFVYRAVECAPWSGATPVRERHPPTHATANQNASRPPTAARCCTACEAVAHRSCSSRCTRAPSGRSLSASSVSTPTASRATRESAAARLTASISTGRERTIHGSRMGARPGSEELDATQWWMAAMARCRPRLREASAVTASACGIRWASEGIGVGRSSEGGGRNGEW